MEAGLLRGLLFLVVGLLGAVLLLSVVSLLLAVHPPRFRSTLTPADLGWRYEPVRVTTQDGLELAAWYIPGEASHPEEAVIVLHGYPFDKGNVLSVTAFLHRRYDLLLFDFRSFGESQGRVTTLGARETYDLQAALAYLRDQRGKRRVGLYGFSLGASVALMAAPKSSLVRAVVADSAFSTLEGMAKDNYRLFWVLQHPMAWLTLTLARVYPRVDPWEVSPLEAVRGWDGPVLLIHGTADSQIGVHHARELERALYANPKAQVWLVEGADHGQAVARFQEAYQEKVLSFFTQYLREQ